VGGPGRRRHGDRPLDRARHHRAGVRSDAARARARGGRRPSAGVAARLADGEERLRAAGLGRWRRSFTEALVPAFLASDTWIHGAFALEQGFIFTSTLLAAATVCIIERRFETAALWCLVGAALSAAGLMHSYRWTFGDTAIALAPAWPWVAGYGAMAAVLLLARFVTVEGEGH
jgi:hypothetical protein